MNDTGKDHFGRLAYSVDEAARITGIGRTTLYALMNSGELPSAKVGRRRIIRSVDLAALVAGRPAASA